MIRKTLNMIILGIMVLGLSTGCAKSNDITDSETKEVSSGAEEDSESEGKFENLDPLDLTLT